MTIALSNLGSPCDAARRGALGAPPREGEVMDRREFMRFSATTAGLMVIGGAATGCAPDPAPPTTAFPQGVASGLHDHQAVVLWTRVEPAVLPVDEVTWLLSTSPDMSEIVAADTVPVSAASDHTVKVLVELLDPDRSYWYRFVAGDDTSQVESPIGRTRTLPLPSSNPPSLRLAFASCQSFASGWYGAWRDVAARELDAVVHLGDYIYESPSIQLLRRVREEPLFEARSVDDYRTKYRHYRADPDLQAAHAAHPWIIVWDDHELHNDWDRSIIDTDRARYDAAMQAWFEYQPVWPVDGNRIHRSHRWGRLAQIFMLDERQYRVPPVDSLFGGGFMGPEAASPDQTMLGLAQRAWLLDGISEASADGVRWNVIGSPQPASPLRVVDLDTPELRALEATLVKHAGFYFGMDSWDSYAGERDLILEHLRSQSTAGTTFLSGDIHAFFAGALQADFDDDHSPVVAHEFTGGSIASAPGGPHTALVEGGGRLSPGFDFVNGTRNGYGVVEYRPGSATVTFMGLDPVWPGAMPAPIYSTTIA